MIHLPLIKRELSRVHDEGRLRPEGIGVVALSEVERHSLGFGGGLYGGVGGVVDSGGESEEGSVLSAFVPWVDTFCWEGVRSVAFG